MDIGPQHIFSVFVPYAFAYLSAMQNLAIILITANSILFFKVYKHFASKILIAISFAICLSVIINTSISMAAFSDIIKTVKGTELAHISAPLSNLNVIVFIPLLAATVTSVIATWFHLRRENREDKKWKK